MTLRKNINRSLLAQALFSNFMLVAASAVLLTGVFVWAQVSSGRRQVGLRAQILTDFVASQCEFSMLVGNRAELERIAHNALGVEDVLFVSMTSVSGDSILLSQPGFRADAIRRAGPKHAASDPALASVGGRNYFEVVRPVWSQTASSVMDWDGAKGGKERIGAVQIGISVTAEERQVTRSVLFAILTLIVSLALVLAVQYAQLRQLLEPLKGLIAFTRRVGHGDLSGRAPVGRLDEVGRLAAAFNRMVEQLGSTTVSKNYVDSIIRSMGEALIVVSPDSRILIVNQAASTMLGYSAKELLGSPALTIFGANSSEPACVGSANAGSSGERVLRSKDGREIQVWFSALPMRGEGVSDGSQVWVALDITARKAAEAQLREAKLQAETANLAKSEFLSRTSHELRTPLNAILGFAQLLEMADLNDDDRESLDQITGAGRHLLSLINEVLDIAGIEAGRQSLSREPVRIGEVSRQAIEMGRGMALARDIDIRADLGEWEERYVLADRQKLQQVLLNLISNAVKYNREGGWVALTCEESAGTVRISVRDSGPGLSAESVAKLFRPFERLGAADTNIEGTGLGLSCSKTFVEAMDGVIGVDSVVGEGSVFWFELTAVAKPVLDGEPAAGEELRRELVTMAPGKVLYVEDNPANLNLVRRILAPYPQIEFVAATRASEGVLMARAERPDLILMDLHLPDFWGDEALRRLRSDPVTRPIPVVMLSADATPAQIEALLAQGAHSYLIKPLECGRLLATMSAILGDEVPVHA